MTCSLSPFAAAQGEPTAPQDGQSHPDGKGMHSNVLWLQPLCSFLCISLGDPLYRIHGSTKVGSTWVSYPGLNLGPFTWRRYYCIIRKSSHVAVMFKMAYGVWLVVLRTFFSITCSVSHLLCLRRRNTWSFDTGSNYLILHFRSILFLVPPS